jgi:hypothetical protein
VIRNLLPFVLSLGACSEAQHAAAKANAHVDHLRYYRCISQAAAKADKGIQAPETILDQAKSQCSLEQQKLTAELIAEVAERPDLTCKDELARVPCLLRDSYERKALKSVRDEISRRRGLPIQPELIY